MVGFKNRYMNVEVFLDPNRDLMGHDPIIITQFNVSKTINDSILLNFGECGLASSLGSFQGKYYFVFSPVYTHLHFTFNTISYLRLSLNLWFTCSKECESHHKAGHN